MIEYQVLESIRSPVIASQPSRQIGPNNRLRFSASTPDLSKANSLGCSTDSKSDEPARPNELLLQGGDELPW